MTDFFIDNLEIRGFRTFDYLKIEQLGHVNLLKTMGDGMNRLLGLGIALAGARNGILLVDEIENGIHWTAFPDLWKFILKVAKRLNVQVFATTQSNDCLKAFHNATRDDRNMDGVVSRIEKAGGEFVAESFDENRMSVIIREGIEIR